MVTFDLTSGWNFEKAHHRKELFKLFYKVCPDFVWLAPPCTVWSPLQNLTERTDDQLYALQCERDYQEHVHLKFTDRVFTEQSSNNRDAAVEQPDRALSWKTPTFEKMRCEDTLLDSTNVPMELCYLMTWATSCPFASQLPCV